MFNPAKLLKIKSAFLQFSLTHPKFVKFIEAIRNEGLTEGSVIEVSFTSASGKTMNSNLKLTECDIQLIKDLSELSAGK